MYGVPMPIPKPYVMGMLIQCAGNPYTLDVREIGMLQNPIIAIWIFMSKDKLIDIVFVANIYTKVPAVFYRLYFHLGHPGGSLGSQWVGA